MTRKKGICYLAGAGPGDPGLVTLKARECIERADIIVYDNLCNPEILQWARSETEIIFAGKSSGYHTLPQEEINTILVEKTKAGKCVVRLKGGDPFLFGRGGEEAAALADAGVDFEVIPGVTAAIAGPAYAGIPVTHRDYSSQFSVFTGHEDPNKADPLDYKMIASLPGTKVMLMGVSRIGKIAASLIEHGADPSTPVALVQWATMGRQRSVAGRLDNIGALVAEAGIQPPAVTIIGDVVGARRKLNWFENRPLFGKRIVVTRSSRQAGPFSAGLTGLGADVIEIPTIRIEPPKDILEFGRLVQDAHTYDWIIFTSPNGVEAFFQMFYKLFEDAREIGGVRIAAIGPQTAQRVRDFHLKVDFQPSESIAESFIRDIQKHGSIENEKLLIIRAEVTRDIMGAALSKAGAIVDEAIAYRTVPETEGAGGGSARFQAGGADLITFTSSSTVENFLALKLPWPAGLKTASIGPATSKTLRDHGLKVDIEASQHDVAGLTQAIQRYYRVS